MKKIGLATCFLDNYGACLQAYSLQAAIEELGNNCEVINYIGVGGYYQKNFRYYLKNNPLTYAVRYVVSSTFRNITFLEKRRFGVFRKFRKKYLALSSAVCRTTEDVVAHSGEYDAFVCGSDQIWNPLFYNCCHPVYYLSFAPDAVPKIAYAPSIGINDIPEEYREQFRTYVNRLNAVSVREKRGAELVAQYTDVTAKWVLDPTMLHDGAWWSKITEPVAVNKPYILCYFFASHPYYAETVERVRQQTGCEVVVLSMFRTPWAKAYREVKTAGPVEFLSLIKNAEYVLTDSFHGTVFSTLFGTSFYTLLRNSDSEKAGMNSRIYSLLEMIGKEDRLLTKSQALEVVPEKIGDFNRVHEKLAELREDSLNFLQTALEE